MNVIKYSNVFSLLSSFSLLILSIHTQNRFLNSRYSACINIAKSFNLINSKWYDKIHHFFSFILSSTYLVLTSNYFNLYSDSLVEEFFIISNVNISTIFLSLRQFYKSNIIDILFVLTFVYYRSIFVFTHFSQGFMNQDFMCFNNHLCIHIINNILSSLCFLNIYWFVLICKKITHKLKK